MTLKILVLAPAVKRQLSDLKPFLFQKGSSASLGAHTCNQWGLSLNKVGQQKIRGTGEKHKLKELDRKKPRGIWSWTRQQMGDESNRRHINQ